jgi:hypothetical protein
MVYLPLYRVVILSDKSVIPSHRLIYHINITHSADHPQEVTKLYLSECVLNDDV